MKPPARWLHRCFSRATVPRCLTSVTRSAAISRLVDLPDASLWTSRTWTDFASLSPAAKRKHLVVLPLFGFADWGLGRPLDFEETLGTAVLRQALGQPTGANLAVHVLPPLRWVAGPYPHCLFSLDFEAAAALLGEIGRSVHAAGFRRLVFCNTSPWNEELIDTVGRDLRAGCGLQPFSINFAALGLDLHPARAASRVGLQCAACACYGTLPADAGVHADITWSDFRPGHVRQPGPVPFAHSLADAQLEGTRLIADSARRLAGWWGEIAARRPLANDGRVPTLRPPKSKRRRKSRNTKGRR